MNQGAISHRDEYNFAKTFFDDIQKSPAMHPFPRLKGYQAIAGIHTLPPAIIKHLMDLPDPVEALNDYALSKGYLKDTPALMRRRLEFASRFLSTEKKRLSWCYAYSSGALFFYLFAFAPLFFGSMEKISMQFAGYLSIITFPLGLFLTATLVRENIQLRRAIHLVKTQNEQALNYEHVDERADDERD